MECINKMECRALIVGVGGPAQEYQCQADFVETKFTELFKFLAKWARFLCSFCIARGKCCF
jgi:hypothetical protein